MSNQLNTCGDLTLCKKTISDDINGVGVYDEIGTSAEENEGTKKLTKTTDYDTIINHQSNQDFNYYPTIGELNTKNFLLSNAIENLRHYGLFAEYNEKIGYDKNAVVHKDNVYYKSLIDDNQGNDPKTSEEAWEVFELGGGGGSGFEYRAGQIKQEYLDNHDLQLLIDKGYIAEANGGIVDISELPQLKKELTRWKNNSSSRILDDDKTWQAEADVDAILRPQKQNAKFRWDTKQFFAYRLAGDITNSKLTLSGAVLPLSYDKNPAPGESPYYVPDFDITTNAKLAFRIIATSLTQGTEKQSGKPIFTLDDTTIIRPTFANSAISYSAVQFSLYQKTCPVVNELPTSSFGYCYNNADSKYYYRETSTVDWTDITASINFVDTLPETYTLGDLYVLNDEKGTKNSIYLAENQTVQGTTKIDDVNTFTFSNFYKSTCPVYETAPETGTGFYYNSTNQLYFYRAAETDNWGDITSKITFADDFPETYSDGAYFVKNDEKGQADAIWVAIKYSITSADLSALKIANCLNIVLTTTTQTVTVSNSYILASYVGSTKIWTIQVKTTDGDCEIGTFTGTEDGAPDYAKGLIKKVADDVGTFKYTHTNAAGTVNVYDGQASYKGTGTIADDVLTFNGTTYNRDSTADNYNGEKYIRVPFIVHIKGRESGETNGDICNQQVPNVTGTTYGEGICGWSSTGVFTNWSGPNSMGAGHTNSAKSQTISIDLSRGNSSYVDNGKVQQSAVVVAFFVVLKNFDINEVLGIGSDTKTDEEIIDEIKQAKLIVFKDCVATNADLPDITKTTPGDAYIVQLDDNKNTNRVYVSNQEKWIDCGGVQFLQSNTKLGKITLQQFDYGETYNEDNCIYARQGTILSRTDYNDYFNKLCALYTTLDADGTHGTTHLATFMATGDGETTFQVPSTAGRVPQTADSASSVGATVEDGAPNITGQLWGRGIEKTSAWGKGAFSIDSSTGDYGSGHEKGTSPIFNFDASKSNSIYGASDHIQPRALLVQTYFCVKVLSV